MAPHSNDSDSKAATGFVPNTAGNSAAGRSAKTKGTSKLSLNPKSKAKTEKKRKSRRQSANKRESPIPKVVSDRMIKRALVFTGVPTVISFTILPLSLVARNREWIELSPTLVFAGSLGFLVIGFVGISYSLLSASWDEEVPGSLLGLRELKLNWRRFQDAQRANKERQKS